MEPYFDPLWQQLDAVEMSIERQSADMFYDLDSDFYMDEFGKILSAVESSVEGAVITPNPSPQIGLPVPDDDRQYAVPDTGKSHPLAPLESVESYWTELQPPAAARPFILSHGITSPPYRSQRHGGTGARSQGTRISRWCSESNQFVSDDVCRECSMWADHGAGYEQCRYEWMEEESEKTDNRTIGENR
jgi:hypothetical protein